VVTRDHDADGSPHANVASGRWNHRSDAAVYYAPRFSTRILERCIRESGADVIWLNSFFSRASLRVLTSPGVRRLARPILLAPRGEFSPGALALKPRRKRVAIEVLRRSRVLDDVQWIASSLLEADEIRSVAGTSSITLIPESIAALTPPDRWPVKQEGRLRVVCASRITPKKNLHFLLDVLGRCRGAIDLDLIGPIDDTAYWVKCQQTMGRLPAHVSVKYVGELPHAGLLERLASYDALLLPTRGENFGHVIVEAWAAGCPVLVSDRTPWRRLSEQGTGWDVPLEPDRWVEAMHRLIALGNDELLAMRKRAIERARQVWNEGRSGDDALRDLIVRTARRNTRPEPATARVPHHSVVADTNTPGSAGKAFR
jgi:glycosyltransferase involved in cell wall biosynthesis